MKLQTDQQSVLVFFLLRQQTSWSGWDQSSARRDDGSACVWSILHASRPGIVNSKGMGSGQLLCNCYWTIVFQCS